MKQAEDGSPFHVVGDVLEAIASFRPDLLIVHPPCTFFSSSGLHWVYRKAERLQELERAVEFVHALIDAAAVVPLVALENPIGYLSRVIRPPDQIVQPYEYGDDASKATCLWLRGLPLLRPTNRIDGRLVWHGGDGGRMVERWSNQTDSGQNKLPPSEHRASDRSRTYPGIAEAMAEQWGGCPIPRRDSSGIHIAPACRRT